LDLKIVISEIESLYRDRDDFMRESRERIIALLEEYKDIVRGNCLDDAVVKDLENQISEAMDDYVQCTEECDQILRESMEKYADVLEFYPEKRKELESKISVSSRVKNQQMIADLQKYNRHLELVKKSFLSKT